VEAGTWEFQALIEARACAGGKRRTVRERVHFVFRTPLADGVTSIRRMKGVSEVRL